MSGTPYLASEDSALLRRALEKYTGDSFLEIGAGNGGSLVELSKRFDLVIGTDMVRPGMADWKGAGTDFILADSASCIRASTFDLVAFNPPYIMAETGDDAAVEGGLGLQVPKKFLREALRVVKRTGSVVFLLNEEADPKEIERICEERGFRLERVLAQRLFFEELVVYAASPRE